MGAQGELAEVQGDTELGGALCQLAGKVPGQDRCRDEVEGDAGLRPHLGRRVGSEPVAQRSGRRCFEPGAGVEGVGVAEEPGGEVDATDGVSIGELVEDAAHLTDELGVVQPARPDHLLDPRRRPVLGPLPHRGARRIAGRPRSEPRGAAFGRLRRHGMTERLQGPNEVVTDA